MDYTASIKSYKGLKREQSPGVKLKSYHRAPSQHYFLRSIFLRCYIFLYDYGKKNSLAKHSHTSN